MCILQRRLGLAGRNEILYGEILLLLFIISKSSSRIPSESYRGTPIPLTFSQTVGQPYGQIDYGFDRAGWHLGGVQEGYSDIDGDVLRRPLIVGPALWRQSEL